MEKLKPGDLVVVYGVRSHAMLTTVSRSDDESQGLAVVWCAGVEGWIGRRFVQPVTIHESAERAIADRVVKSAQA